MKKWWKFACLISTAVPLWGSGAEVEIELPPSPAGYRVFDESTPQHVQHFYAENHAKQTYKFAVNKAREYGKLNRGKMTIWEALQVFDSLVDESDPDTSRPQRYHLYQTAEAIRHNPHLKKAYPAGESTIHRSWILTGFIHDLGKILLTHGEPQWAVVGDTFPVGYPYSNSLVFPAFFLENPDADNPLFSTKLGIYQTGCGLENVRMSWGHDEYLYQVLKGKTKLLPKFLYLIRYHSFYAHHHEHAYEALLSQEDQKWRDALYFFSKFDLYSKTDAPLDIEALEPYYKALVEEFIPEPLDW